MESEVNGKRLWIAVTLRVHLNAPNLDFYATVSNRHKSNVPFEAMDYKTQLFLAQAVKAWAEVHMK